MGSTQTCFCCHGTRHVIISLLLLSVSSLTQVTFMAEGRAIPKLHEAALGGHDEEKATMVRNRIGSIPPRCDRRCNSCGHCEAIQVPVATQSQRHRSIHFSSATLAISYSRGDDISNYKPMSWKCKCGNLIFNP